jgi:hypothetical protein
MLTTLFAEIQFQWEGWNLPGLFMLLALLAPLAFLHFRDASLSRQRCRSNQPPARPDSSLLDSRLEKESSRQPLFKTQLLQDLDLRNAKRRKRSSLRRAGNPIEVLISDALATAPTTEGRVLDRSRGGLLLSVGQPVAVGTTLSVRAAHAPDEVSWVRIKVRHCRHREDLWLVGCAFEQELPWSVLLLFG